MGLLNGELCHINTSSVHSHLDQMHSVEEHAQRYMPAPPAFQDHMLPFLCCSIPILNVAAWPTLSACLYLDLG